jgi:hypothetical protein
MYRDNDDAFELDPSGKRVLKDKHRYRLPLTMKDASPLQRAVAADSHRGRIVDSYGNTKFHRPGWRLGDASFSDGKEAAYREYRDALVKAYKNPGGDVGSGSHWPTSPSTDPAPAGAYPHTAEPKDEGREQSSFDPIEDKLSEIRVALRGRGYGAEEIQDFIDRINDEDDDAILGSGVQARIREFEMKRGQGTPRQQTDSAASIRDRQHAHQQRMNKIYRDIELEISSAWRTPAGPTPNVT